MNRSYRPALIVGGYGALAGVMAAMTYILMEHVQHLLWQNPYAQGPLYTIAVIMGGGLLLSLLYRLNATAPSDLNAQLQQAHDPLRQIKRATLLTALIAIVSVGFGGAVGPEAGLIAVVSECSAILALHLARNQAEQRLIGDSGSIAALSACTAHRPALPPSLMKTTTANRPRTAYRCRSNCSRALVAWRAFISPPNSCWTAASNN